MLSRMKVVLGYLMLVAWLPLDWWLMLYAIGYYADFERQLTNMQFAFIFFPANVLYLAICHALAGVARDARTIRLRILNAVCFILYVSYAPSFCLFGLYTIGFFANFERQLDKEYFLLIGVIGAIVYACLLWAVLCLARQGGSTSVSLSLPCWQKNKRVRRKGDIHLF